MSADGAAPTRPGSFSNIPNPTRAAIGLDGLGATTSLIAANLPSGPAQTTVATASGLLWGASGATNQATSSSRWDTLTNLTAGAAGLLSSASALTNQFAEATSAAAVGYASSASWALGGAVSAVRGTASLFSASDWRGRVHGGLTALSGALNVTGAGFAASAAHASAENDTATASYHGTLSSAAWLGGTVAGLGAAYFSPPPSRPSVAPSPLRSLEEGLGGSHDGASDGGHGPALLGRPPTESTPLRSAPIPIPPRVLPREVRTSPASQSPPQSLSPHDSPVLALPPVQDRPVLSSSALRPDLATPPPKSSTVPALNIQSVTPPDSPVLSPRVPTPPRRASLGSTTPVKVPSQQLSSMPAQSPARSRSGSGSGTPPGIKPATL